MVSVKGGETNNWTLSMENSTGPLNSTTAHSPGHSHKNWGTVWGAVLWMVHDHCLVLCIGCSKRNKIIKLMYSYIGQVHRILATNKLQPMLSFATMLLGCLLICFTAHLSTDPWGKPLIVSLYSAIKQPFFYTTSFNYSQSLWWGILLKTHIYQTDHHILAAIFREL